MNNPKRDELDQKQPDNSLVNNENNSASEVEDLLDKWLENFSDVIAEIDIDTDLTDEIMQLPLFSPIPSLTVCLAAMYTQLGNIFQKQNNDLNLKLANICFGRQNLLMKYKKLGTFFEPSLKTIFEDKNVFLSSESISHEENYLLIKNRNILRL